MNTHTHFALEITRQRQAALIADADREREARLVRTDRRRRRTLPRWTFALLGSRSFRDAAGAPGKS